MDEPQPKAGKGRVSKSSVARRLPKLGGMSARLSIATLPFAVRVAGGEEFASVAGRKSTTCTPVAASGPRLATSTSKVTRSLLPASTGPVLPMTRSERRGGVGVGVGVDVGGGGGTKRRSSHLSGTGQVLSSLTCEMSPMSAAPIKPPLD